MPSVFGLRNTSVEWEVRAHPYIVAAVPSSLFFTSGVTGVFLTAVYGRCTSANRQHSRDIAYLAAILKGFEKEAEGITHTLYVVNEDGHEQEGHPFGCRQTGGRSTLCARKHQPHPKTDFELRIIRSGNRPPDFTPANSFNLASWTICTSRGALF